VCCAILGVRVLLLEMKIKWCVERKMRWPEENKMMEEQEKYEDQIYTCGKDGRY